MIKIIKARMHQGYRTHPYPLQEPSLPERFRGRPVIEGTCMDHCSACIAACPTGAISRRDGSVAIDIGRCLFCTACTELCTAGCIRFTCEYRLAAKDREALQIGPGEAEIAAALDEQAKRLFGRSLKLRQVSAGGCNACEADTNVLNTLTFDLGRFGIQFVASPRHADGILVTGPVTENMRLALEKTYAAMPSPKLVIAVGACSISGGPYAGHPEVSGGLDSIIPVNLFVPGCPPNPWTILDGLLRLLGAIG